jgi:hypothetical protein
MEELDLDSFCALGPLNLNETAISADDTIAQPAVGRDHNIAQPAVGAYDNIAQPAVGADDNIDQIDGLEGVIALVQPPAKHQKIDKYSDVHLKLMRDGYNNYKLTLENKRLTNALQRKTSTLAATSALVPAVAKLCGTTPQIAIGRKKTIEADRHVGGGACGTHEIEN